MFDMRVVVVVFSLFLSLISEHYYYDYLFTRHLNEVQRYCRVFLFPGNSVICLGMCFDVLCSLWKLAPISLKQTGHNLFVSISTTPKEYSIPNIMCVCASERNSNKFSAVTNNILLSLCWLNIQIDKTQKLTLNILTHDRKL